MADEEGKAPAAEPAAAEEPKQEGAPPTEQGEKKASTAEPAVPETSLAPKPEEPKVDEPKPEEPKVEEPKNAPEEEKKPGHEKDEAEKKPPHEGKHRRGSMFDDGGAIPGLNDESIKAAPGTAEEKIEKLFSKKAASGAKVAKKKPKRPKLIYENTYRLVPKRPFIPSYVESCIKMTLHEVMPNYRYTIKGCSEFAGEVAEKIRTRVINCRFERFKFVVLVVIGQRRRQGVHNGFKCLWDIKHDSYAFGEFVNHKVYATATVCGIYFE